MNKSEFIKVCDETLQMGEYERKCFASFQALLEYMKDNRIMEEYYEN